MHSPAQQRSRTEENVGTIAVSTISFDGSRRLNSMSYNHSTYIPVQLTTFANRFLFLSQPSKRFGVRLDGASGEILSSISWCANNMLVFIPLRGHFVVQFPACWMVGLLACCSVSFHSLLKDNKPTDMARIVANGASISLLPICSFFVNVTSWWYFYVLDTRTRPRLRLPAALASRPPTPLLDADTPTVKVGRRSLPCALNLLRMVWLTLPRASSLVTTNQPSSSFSHRFKNRPPQP
mmetsp:Transcript_20681/g.58901  ORF Transcript_20681/g.58901 Transcript_20681/m.58901 type:complete len:237 (-) Transcript_20681:1868-2578(-)